ncbi:hypothetical protein TARUN_9694 [Trichoderma arundinaceum]|uniref:Uncharacterized protein n=1 Tax=Trichoderma arundinaceum TaxID=490622 RepID=A0A395NA49_TRIAR|nr:hypothetical protein TARUN_9694 [Trichoderma arundinaceum]
MPAGISDWARRVLALDAGTGQRYQKIASLLPVLKEEDLVGRVQDAAAIIKETASSIVVFTATPYKLSSWTQCSILSGNSSGILLPPTIGGKVTQDRQTEHRYPRPRSHAGHPRKPSKSSMPPPSSLVNKLNSREGLIRDAIAQIPAHSNLPNGLHPGRLVIGEPPLHGTFGCLLTKIGQIVSEPSPVTRDSHISCCDVIWLPHNAIQSGFVIIEYGKGERKGARKLDLVQGTKVHTRERAGSHTWAHEWLAPAASLLSLVLRTKCIISSLSCPGISHLSSPISLLYAALRTRLAILISIAGTRLASMRCQSARRARLSNLFPPPDGFYKTRLGTATKPRLWLDNYKAQWMEKSWIPVPLGPSCGPSGCTRDLSR